MGTAFIAPRKDTVRVVSWDELPESVKEINVDLGSLGKSLLMGHQAAWVKLQADIKVAKKGRRAGITFAEALDDSITAASSREAGGDNVFYCGDTKEKGLEFIGYCAKLSRTMARAQGKGISEIEEFLFADQDEDGNTRHITAYRIRYASGFQVVALSSNPSNIRGLQGIVVIDEAAFHKNVQAVLDAATALLIWGGKIRIISTHNGVKNPFNQLIKDIEAGRYGEDAKVFTATFDDAVANGLYERRCLIKGEKATSEGKMKWYNKIRNAYGPRKAQMMEELDAIPRDGNGVCIPGIWIERAMTEERPVLRLTLDDDFARLPVDERKSYVKDWITRYLKPELDKLDPLFRWYYGQDYARHRDFSIITPLGIRPNLTRTVPFVIEMHKVPAAQQHQILWAMIKGMPGYPCGALDATGSGETTAEFTADKFGWSRVGQVKITRTWYGLWMPKMIQLFEDSSIDLPKDANLEQDIRSIENVEGIPMVTSLKRADLKDPDLMRHGDFAPALCLANFAYLTLHQGPVTVSSRGERRIHRLIQGYD